MSPDNSVTVETRAEWRAWLAAHHGRGEGIWLVRYKKASGRPTISTDDYVEEAIAFGWIDSMPKKVDAERHAVWVAPRKPGSNWSALSKRRARRMAAAGLLHPAGEACIIRAKADGSWSALDDVERGVIPTDLSAVLLAHPPAAEHWAAFPKSTQRGILEWIHNAKTAGTRTKRIIQTATLAQVNQRANQWSRRRHQSRGE